MSSCIKPWERNRSIICSHTEKEDVCLWDLQSQENIDANSPNTSSTPDLILKGHTDITRYALGKYLAYSKNL